MATNKRRAAKGARGIQRRPAQIGPPLTQAGEFIDLEEAAQYLRRPKRTVEDLARARTLPGYKTGKRWLFRLDELRAWVQSHATAKKATEGQQEPLGA